MTDTSSLDMSTASLVSGLESSQHTESSSGMSSLPSLPSLPSPSLVEDPTLRMPYPSTGSWSSAQLPSSSRPGSSSVHTLPVEDHKRKDDDAPHQAARRRRPSTRRLILGHARSLFWAFGRFLFKDNNWTLMLNLLAHVLAARQLWQKSRVAVRRYTNLSAPSPTTTHAHNITVTNSATLLADAFRAQGVLHLALGILASLAIKERRLSTERTALWVLAIASWGQSFVQIRSYLQSPALYTLRALQEFGAMNGILTIVTTIALKNTIRRTGRYF
ncbi:hypothetical protein BC940DRAFT_306124 [Gongronella butleri]|nr:hypothetical protein BC940DRAFT_306124 [Gongronella butleri]